MNRKLWENLVSLLSVHALNYIAPLVTLPFLTRVLGPTNWGKLAFAEAYANYLSLVIEYGFGLSATRDVAQSHDDKDLHSKLLTSVLSAQCVLTALSAVATLLLARIVPSLHQYAELLPLALLLATFRAVTPLWYFQGLERMRLVAGLNITVNLCSAALIITVVHNPSQTWAPIAIRAAAAFIAASSAFLIAYRNVRFSPPNITDTWQVLRDGWSIFLFRSAVSLYTTGNVLLIGVLAPAQAVAWFAGAERILKSAISAFGPISQTFYPRISNLLKTDPTKAAQLARTSLAFTVGIGLLLSITILLTAPILVRVLLGSHYEESTPVLRCLSLSLPLIACSMVLGIQWMLPMRLDTAYTKIIFTAGILNIALATTLAPHFRQMGMAFSVSAAELFVTTAVVIVLRRKGLDPWSSPATPVAIEPSCATV